MSESAFDWAWQQDVRPATTKLVLLSLADHSYESGLVCLNYLQIGRDCGIDFGDVQKHIDKLEKMGYIIVRDCSENYRQLVFSSRV